MTPGRSTSSSEKAQFSQASLINGEERAFAQQVKQFFGEHRGHYIVEWGVRITDLALIFHFYPNPDIGGWEVDFSMPTRLENALARVFDTDRINAGFTEEENSFHVIAGGYGRGFDQRPLVKRFLDAVDA